MDPVTAVGLALSVAGIAGQVFKGCIQGIQFIITAKNLPEDSKYLNLRLRMEQQRLFAWSETSGLLDLDASNEDKIRDSNTFIVHRTTILDLLVQIKCLFEEFEKAQRRNKNLLVSPEPAVDDVFVEDPAEDSSSAHVPLPKRRRDFIIKAMKAVKSNTTDPLMEGRRRLVWAAFQKDDFECLLQRFSTLNDNMTDILDARLQTEIHRTTQDTNRGVLQLHKNIASLHQLVMALNIKLQAQSYPVTSSQQYSSASEAAGLRLLAQLAKFKAFNESMDVDKSIVPWDEATAKVLQLGQPDIEQASIKIDKSSLTLLGPSTRDSDVARCEALYDHNGYKQRVWIEWKEYELQDKSTSSPPPIIIDRVQKLAALLHHSPKPEAFRVPHCLGYFHNTIHSTGTDTDSDGEEDGEARIGFVFERPQTEDILPETPPISLFDLLSSSKRPRVTDRIKLAHAISNCLLYLHSVNWLHKGLRSHNIVFFSVTKEKRTLVDYSKPYLSGFDFARPARKDEMTEVPWDVPEYNLYRHPSTQSNAGFGSREGFRKSFDIYSLGVVLIELAHWATIDKVLGIPKGKVRATGKIREVLLDKERIADVGANMGEVFENATRKCIAGGKELGIDEGDDETSDTVAAKLGYHFYEEVVKRLGDVKV